MRVLRKIIYMYVRTCVIIFVIAKMKFIVHLLLCLLPLGSCVNIPKEWRGALTRLCREAENGAFPHPSPFAQLNYGIDGTISPHEQVNFTELTQHSPFITLLFPGTVLPYASCDHLVAT